MAKRSKVKAPRDKCAAKARARRQAAKPKLYTANIPFEPYQQWFHLDRQVDLSGDPEAAALLDLVRPLGEYYGDRVPMAALYLEEQIQKGVVRLGITSSPGSYQEMPIAEFAADMSNLDLQAQVREMSPGFIGDDPIKLTEQEAGGMLHQIVAKGIFLMDDDHCLHLTTKLAEIL